MTMTNFIKDHGAIFVTILLTAGMAGAGVLASASSPGDQTKTSPPPASRYVASESGLESGRWVRATIGGERDPFFIEIHFHRGA